MCLSSTRGFTSTALPITLSRYTIYSRLYALIDTTPFFFTFSFLIGCQFSYTIRSIKIEESAKLEDGSELRWSVKRGTIWRNCFVYT